MSLVLNTNINSLVAQNSLTSSGNQLATALQQLSSGLRINTAADDAAGYAIVQGMTSQINGLNQAAQNAGDGVSLAQTASGAMQEITNDLQSMRDLAVESLNASNGANDRTDLNAQFQQLMSDINSVASQTQFNGVTLLDGTFQGATFQVGANAGQSITMASIASSKASEIGNYYKGLTSVAGTVMTASGSSISTGTATAGAYNSATLAGTTGLNTAVDGSTVTLSVTVNGGTAIDTGPITLTGTASTDLTSIAAAINQALSPVGGLVATVNSDDTGIDISGTVANGAGNVVNFAVASATAAGGSAVTAGTGTLAALGVDSSDIIGTYTTAGAGGTGASTQLASGGTQGSYSSSTLSTALSASKELVGSGTTYPAYVTLSVDDGTGTYTTGTIQLNGNESHDLSAIANALNATDFGTGTGGDGFTAAVTGDEITITGTSTTNATISVAVNSATGTGGQSVTPSTVSLAALGIDSAYTYTGSSGSATTATGGTAGDYDNTTLNTELETAYTLGSSNAATVYLTATVNGTTYTTGPISLDGNQTSDVNAVVSALNDTAGFTDAGFSAKNTDGQVEVDGSGTTDASVQFGVSNAYNTIGTNVTSSVPAGLVQAMGLDSGDDYTAATVGSGGTAATSSSVQYLNGLNVNTVDNSNLVLVSIDNALQQIATSSADLGAYQDRFQSAITGLNTDATNLQSARSSIQDTDYAQATSTLSQAQILQQASTAMVAQANTVPQNVLTLLQKLP